MCWQFHCESDWKKADIDEAEEESESDVRGKNSKNFNNCKMIIEKERLNE